MPIFRTLIIFLMQWVGHISSLHQNRYLDPDICTFSDNALVCTCENQQNMSLTTSIGTIEELVVQNCSYVTLSMGTLSFKRMELIEFSDLQMLTIRSFSFLGTEIGAFLLKNISNLQLMMHGFDGVHSIDHLLLDGVTADSIQKESFTDLNNVKTVRISNCYFEEVQSLAFRIMDASAVVIENSRFGQLANKSFMFTRVDKVIFIRMRTRDATEFSFVIRLSRFVAFDKCTFGTLHMAAFSIVDAEEFVFTNAVINYSLFGAFDFINATRRMVFLNNVFFIAKKNSILPNDFVNRNVKETGLTFQYGLNRFTCNCQIAWMLDQQSRYANVLNASYCIGSWNQSLHELAVILDENNNCTGLTLKEYMINNKSGHSCEVPSNHTLFLSFLLLILMLT